MSQVGGHMFSVDNTDLLPCPTEAHLGDVDRMLKPSESQSLMKLRIFILVLKPSDTFWVGETAVDHIFWGISPFLVYFGYDFLGRVAQRSTGNGCCKRKMNIERTIVYKEHAVCQEVG